MSKLNNLTSIVIYAVLALSILLIILLFRSFGPSVELDAHLSDYSISTGSRITYADSTQGAKSWLWEFGNGDESEQRSGQYSFTKAGEYRVRLTVNGKSEKLFTVHVIDSQDDKISKIAQIEAPDFAMQGENIVFRGVGMDKQWRWEFGESGMVDAREKEPIYAYSEPGTYTITLTTENTQYPVYHTIEIAPQYMESDSTDVLTVIGLDIKEKLQNIVDGKPFNSNYNYIVNKYLGSNEKTEVVINNTKFNDVYSYCQGLRLASGHQTVIEQVAVEIADMEVGYVTKIIVLQADKRK